MRHRQQRQSLRTPWVAFQCCGS